LFQSNDEGWAMMAANDRTSRGDASWGGDEASADDEVRWEGVPFLALYHHDARMIRHPGLFAFVHRGPSGERAMLFIDHADDIAQAAVPSHALWSEARWHGMNEVHVCLSARARIDRLQLRAHLLRRLRPPLNRADAPPAAETGWRGALGRAAGR
jgi:hypothetical protein